MTISGKTTLIAHLGYPTESFKAPMIYNPWFEARGIDVQRLQPVLVDDPLGSRALFVRKRGGGVTIELAAHQGSLFVLHAGISPGGPSVAGADLQ